MDLRKMLSDLYAERSRIEKAIEALEQLNSEPRASVQRKTARTTAAAPAPRRRTMSPSARKRISEMMKKRWAERRRKAA